MAKLIIFSGLPASGKSTLSKLLATELKATHLRIDTIEQGLKEICGISKLDGKGYEMAHRMARDNLLLGNTVIADSVNPWTLTRHAWDKVASEIGVPFTNVEVVCSDKNEHRRRAEARGASVPGLKAPTWEEILKRDYHPWESERIVIETSGKSIQESLNALLKELK